MARNWGAGFDENGIASRLLGWTKKGFPVTADSSSKASKFIANDIASALVPPNTIVSGGDEGAGTLLEREVENFLNHAFTIIGPEKTWKALRGRKIAEFTQYRHLRTVQELIDNDTTGTLRQSIGTDYVITPDISVWREDNLVDPNYLHASISCKWSIRSDRVQNIRHESIILTRHRRGRTPHIVVVTAEPLPSRLAAIARGTGEIDKTYHLALTKLGEAVGRLPGREKNVAEQQRILQELIDHSRLADITDLPVDLLA